MTAAKRAGVLVIVFNFPPRCENEYAVVYSAAVPKIDLTFTPGLHPLYAVLGIAFLALVADLIPRMIPFYHRELQLEETTRATPIDGLRGILCFAVMFHHAAIMHAFLPTGLWVETPSVFYVLLGQTSVALFFCITAFLFWGRALDRSGNIPAFAFLRGRWFRLVPLYVFTAAVVLTIVRKQIHWSWSHHETWWSIGSMGLMGLRLWYPVDGADVNSVNAGVTWSLQHEWIFYFAFPALAMLVKGGSPWRIIFIALALWVVDGVDAPMDVRAFFLTGILAAHVARMPRTAAVLRSVFVSIAILGILTVMPLLVTGGYGWIPLLFTTVVFVPIACGNSMLGILKYPGLRMMGTISYSVYLLHGIFLYEGRPLLKQALAYGDLQYWLAIFATGCVVLACCSITYAVIEWPFIALEKSFRKWSGVRIRVSLPNRSATALSAPAIS